MCDCGPHPLSQRFDFSRPRANPSQNSLHLHEQRLPFGAPHDFHFIQGFLETGLHLRAQPLLLFFALQLTRGSGRGDHAGKPQKRDQVRLGFYAKFLAQSFYSL